MLVPHAGQLLQDLEQLDERLRALAIPPERLASAAARLLRRVADHLPSDGPDRHGLSEASDLQGTLDGTRKVAGLLSPLLAKAAPALDADITRRFTEFSSALDPYRDGEGFKPMALDAARRQALAAPLRALADDLDRVNGALGLE